MHATHEVFSQPVPLAGYNLFASHRALRDALHFNAPQLPTAVLEALGALVGTPAMQAQTAPAAVTDAFCASRLGGDWGHAFGTLGRGADVDAIIARAMPR